MTLPVTVIVPTIGRPDQLQRCLESIAGCSPPPAEVVVVDQSDEGSATGSPGARVVRCHARGIPSAMNHGLREARHEVVLVTHDDATVAPDWVQRAHAHVTAFPLALHTGRVLPVGDPHSVPSTITDETPRRYTSPRAGAVLYPNNMAGARDRFLAHGFDPFLVPAAEDNDLCFRWLKSGEVHYQPDMVVWHHDWRAPGSLEELYRGYAYGHGLFLAKHLLRRDRDAFVLALGVLRRALRDAVRNLDDDPAEQVWWRAARHSLMRGFAAGVRHYRSGEKR